MTEPPSRRPRRTSRPDRAGASRGRRSSRNSAPPTTGPGRRVRSSTLAAPAVPAVATNLANSKIARQIAVLGLVLCVVALSLAYPLRNYLAQRADLAAAVAQQHELEQRIVELQIQQSALADPQYIAAEAKRRLQYVKPGDTVYVVQAPALESGAADAPTGDAPTGPWYNTLWDTLSNTGGAAVDPSVLQAPVTGTEAPPPDQITPPTSAADTSAVSEPSEVPSSTG